jgi:hypothetical protein
MCSIATVLSRATVISGLTRCTSNRDKDDSWVLRSVISIWTRPVVVASREVRVVSTREVGVVSTREVGVRVSVVVSREVRVSVVASREVRVSIVSTREVGVRVSVVSREVRASVVVSREVGVSIVSSWEGRISVVVSREVRVSIIVSTREVRVSIVVSIGSLETSIFTRDTIATPLSVISILTRCSCNWDKDDSRGGWLRSRWLTKRRRDRSSRTLVSGSWGGSTERRNNCRFSIGTRCTIRSISTVFPRFSRNDNNWREVRSKRVRGEERSRRIVLQVDRGWRSAGRWWRSVMNNRSDDNWRGRLSVFSRGSVDSVSSFGSRWSRDVDSGRFTRSSRDDSGSRGELGEVNVGRVDTTTSSRRRSGRRSRRWVGSRSTEWRRSSRGRRRSVESGRGRDRGRLSIGSRGSVISIASIVTRGTRKERDWRVVWSERVRDVGDARNVHVACEDGSGEGRRRTRWLGTRWSRT